MRKILCSTCLVILASGCMRVTLTDIQQHIDNYYQSKHPTWSEKKAAVEIGRATTLMTLTEVKLATSVRKINSAGYVLADFYFYDNGCWLGKTSQKAGGLLWWTVTRPKDYGYYIGAIEIPEYTYYFKWEDSLGEYMCYDWVQW